MAISDIFTLRNSIAPRLIRSLYFVALVLIAIMVVLGVVRGIRIMSFTPRPMPAIGAPPPSGATQSTTPQTAMPPRPGNRMMMRRFRRPGMMGPRAPFGLGRNPVAAGAFTIFFALLRGAIALMVVRILAEIGIAILAMPRRTEI
jgi:hypothetical protein